MAEKRASRQTRFQFYKDLYGMVEAGYATEDQAKAQVGFTGHVLYKTEVPKFEAANPEINAEGFAAFLVNVGGLKSGGRVLTGRGGSTSLDSDAKIAQLGILPENVDEYKSIIGNIQSEKKRLAELIKTPHYGTSFSITLNKKAAADAPTPQA